jgi:hypothetical protein
VSSDSQSTGESLYFIALVVAVCRLHGVQHGRPLCGVVAAPVTAARGIASRPPSSIHLMYYLRPYYLCKPSQGDLIGSGKCNVLRKQAHDCTKDCSSDGDVVVVSNLIVRVHRPPGAV